MPKRKVSNDKIKNLIRKKNNAPDEDELIYDLTSEAEEPEPEAPKKEPAADAEKKQTKKTADDIIKHIEHLFRTFEESTNKRIIERKERAAKLAEEREKRRLEELQQLEHLILTGKKKAILDGEQQAKEKLKKTVRQTRISSLLF